MITNEQIAEFHKNGVLVIPNFYNYEEEIKPIQKNIYDIIDIIIEKYNLNIKRKPFNGENFDNGIMKILEKDRKYISELYDAIKHSVPLVRLLSSDKNELLSKCLLKSDLIGIASKGYGIRIDLPKEEQYRSFWHQEYPAQLRSLKGLVFWTPLVTIKEKLGPVEVCVGSHKEGILPVFKTSESNRQNAYTLKIYDEISFVKKYTKNSPLTKPSDLIIIDWLVLHQSGYNVSKKPRWSIQMRYFDYNEPLGKKISWKGSFAEGVNFEEIHPNLLIEE